MPDRRDFPFSAAIRKPDPFLGIAVAAMLGSGLLYVLPFASTTAWTEWKGHWIEFAFLVMTATAWSLRIGRAGSTAERRFATFLTAGCGVYLVTFLLLVRDWESAWGRALVFAEEFLVLSYYLLLFLAAGTNPDQKAPRKFQQRLLSLGNVVFFFGALTYLVLIPRASGLGDSVTPALFLYILMDISLVLLFVRMRQTSSSPAWRTRFTLLAASSFAWAVLDGIETLMMAEVLPLAYGHPVDLLWILPYLPLIAAARIPVEAPEASAPGGAVPSSGAPGHAAQLIVYLGLIPILHFTLSWTGRLPEATRVAYEACVLTLLLVLGAIALLNQKEQGKERRRVDRQLRQAQKMESLGTLAGGIAHSFNNLLTVILGHTQLSLAREPRRGRSRPNLQEVMKAGLRAKDLVQQILAFSHAGEPVRETFRLEEVLDEAIAIVRASRPVSVDLRVHIRVRDCLVRADSSAVHQIVLNLCTNAIHALEGREGFLEVALDSVRAADDQHLARLGLESGLFYRLRVSDNGCGMTSEVQERIFDPFFTTKGAGRGTGLGLAVVYGIAREAGGGVDVESAPERGTDVRVYLPRARTRAAAARDPQPVVPGRGNVMVVDDENAEILQQMLESLGYEVSVFDSPVQALEAFRRGPGRFDLVIADHSMPRMTGPVLAGEIIRARADLPILLCTGHGDILARGAPRMEGIRGMIAKPFLLDELSQAVSRALAPGQDTRETSR